MYVYTFVFCGCQTHIYTCMCVYIYVCVYVCMYVYIYMCVCMHIQYIDVLVYCHAKVDEYPCVLLNAGLADLPRRIIPFLLRHSAMHPLYNNESLRNELAPWCLPQMQTARPWHHGNVERQLRIAKASASQSEIC